MIQWLRGTQKKIQQLTLEVASATRELVWERTQSKIYGMSGAEARGYARARARVIIGRSADSILSDRRMSLSASARHQVVANALEAVVDWIVDRRHQMQPATVPVRRAA